MHLKCIPNTIHMHLIILSGLLGNGHFYITIFLEFLENISVSPAKRTNGPTLAPSSACPCGMTTIIGCAFLSTRSLDNPGGTGLMAGFDGSGTSTPWTRKLYIHISGGSGPKMAVHTPSAGYSQ